MFSLANTEIKNKAIESLRLKIKDQLSVHKIDKLIKR